MRWYVARAITTAVLVTIALASAPQAQPAFDQMVVLGDSLSDTGNAGRFSNGGVWTETLGRRLGVPVLPSGQGGTNFAVGGARLDPGSGSGNLRAQADRFLSGRRPAGKVLHVVYGGANDLLGTLGQPNSPAVRTAATSLQSIVLDLVRTGATDILVPNLPDLGITPAVRSRGAQAQAEARGLTDAFNEAVDTILRDIAAQTAGSVRIIRLDVHGLADRVMRDPRSFGFTDVSRPCGSSRCDGFLFWDEVHPTAQAHARLGDAAFEAVAQAR